MEGYSKDTSYDKTVDAGGRPLYVYECKNTVTGKMIRYNLFLNGGAFAPFGIYFKSYFSTL